MDSASQEDVSNVKELFNLCDSDNDGGISIIELDILLRYLHKSPNMEQLKKLFADIDLDNNGIISLSEFYALLGNGSDNISRQGNADQSSITEKSFKIFDSDNNGIINLNELDQMMQFLDHWYTEVELTKIMSSVDDDDSGNIDILEYQNLLAKTASAQSPTEGQSNLRQKFLQTDKDHDGLISLTELYYEVIKGAEDITPLQVQTAFNTADVDKNHQLNFEEFVKLTK